MQSHEIHNLETYTQYLVSLQVFNPEGPGKQWAAYFLFSLLFHFVFIADFYDKP